MAAKQLNDRVNDFLEKTLWIWLPFAALIILIKELIAKHERKD